jgi:hypothetical protein
MPECSFKGTPRPASRMYARVTSITASLFCCHVTYVYPPNRVQTAGSAPVSLRPPILPAWQRHAPGADGDGGRRHKQAGPRGHVTGGCPPTGAVRGRGSASHGAQLAVFPSRSPTEPDGAGGPGPALVHRSRTRTYARARARIDTSRARPHAHVLRSRPVAAASATAIEPAGAGAGTARE